MPPPSPPLPPSSLPDADVSVGCESPAVGSPATPPEKPVAEAESVDQDMYEESHDEESE